MKEALNRGLFSIHKILANFPIFLENRLETLKISHFRKNSKISGKFSNISGSEVITIKQESVKKKRVMFRVSDEELRFIKSQSKKYGGVSEYLRSILNDKMPVEKNIKIRTTLMEMNYFLNKIGTNINQISKNNNSKLYKESDRKKLFCDLEEIKNQFNDLKKTICDERSDGNV